METCCFNWHEEFSGLRLEGNKLVVNYKVKPVLSFQVFEVHVIELCGINCVVTVKFTWWTENFSPLLQILQIASAEINLFEYLY